MSSVAARPKQIPANNGYYIAIADTRTTFYYNAGTDSAPLISTNAAALASKVSTILATTGAIFRDHGKTLLSSGRVFRKVQLMVSTNTVGNLGTDGVSGVASTTTNPGYFTGYIELPGQGGNNTGQGAASAAGPYTPVARLG